MRLQTPRKMATFTLAQLEDADALVTSVATSLTAVTYQVATMDGALANPGPAVMRLPQRVRIATTAVAACYNTTAPVVFTGTDDTGATVTESITLANAGGNEVRDGSQQFAGMVSIAVPAQLKNTGAFEFGVTDLAFSAERPCVDILIGANGNVVVELEDGTTETIAALASDRLPGIVLRIVDTNTTCDPITAFVGRSHV